MTFTRKQYLDGLCTHEEYCRDVAKTAGISFVKAELNFMDRCKKALANGDKYLNTIPLDEWDKKASLAYHYGLRDAFKAHGDFYSIAGGVSVIKQAVRDAINK